MKTAEEVLKSKLDPKILILNNPDYTFIKVIEAMEEYASQFKTVEPEKEEKVCCAKGGLLDVNFDCDRG